MTPRACAPAYGVQDRAVTQGYLYRLEDGAVSDIRSTFRDRWPEGSPWYDQKAVTDRAIHPLFKWAADREPRTVDLHRAVEEQHRSVWWGKFGTRQRAALSAKNLNMIRGQLQAGTPTKVFIYGPGDVWETDLVEITAALDEVDLERLPSYYGKDECKLFVRIANFERRDNEYPLSHLVLASDPDPAKMPGALGNQGTPLMVRMRGAGIPVTHSESEETCPTSSAWWQVSTRGAGLPICALVRARRESIPLPVIVGSMVHILGNRHPLVVIHLDARNALGNR